MVHVTVNNGIDVLENYYLPSSNRDSSNNPYKDWHNDMRVGFYEEADYGNDANWTGSGSGINVETTFPVPPSPGVLFVRTNTNGGGNVMRQYRYNGAAAAWQRVEYT